MKIYQTETVTLTREALKETVCDICKNAFRTSRGMYHDMVVTITAEDRTSYGYEGGEAEKYEPDICWDCFVDKVIPALKALGVDIEWEKRDW